MAKPKIKYGLKNVHYAPFVEAGGVVIYDTPVRIPGAVNINMSPEGENIEFFADDLTYFGGEANQGYAGTIEVALIPDDFRKDILGEVEDANGALVENADIIPKPFALMFEFTTDKKGVRHVMYNVAAARPDVSGSTKTKSIEPQTETLNIVASPASDTYDVKAKLPYSEDPAYTGFYTAVYVKNAVTNTKGADPADFSKGSPVDVTVTSTSSGDAEIKNVILAGVPVPGVSLTVAGLAVTIAQAYVGALDTGTYALTVEFTKGNAAVYSLVVKA